MLSTNTAVQSGVPPSSRAANIARLQLTQVQKNFGPNQVLKGISLSLQSGQILALMGENGAGKSTLMKLISGVYADYSGEINWNGEVCHFNRPGDAEAEGIVMVHQELNLIAGLSVAENIFLGKEPKTRWGGVDFKTMEARAAQWLKALGCDINPHTPLANLRVGEQQLVEIAKALSCHARLLILDEPTAALSEAEVAQLFSVIKRLRDDGVAILYISHRLEEIFQLASHIAVLRNGELVEHCETQQLNRDQLIQHMVGRDVDEFYASAAHQQGRRLLALQQLSLPSLHYQQTGAGRPFDLKEITLAVNAGEVLGIAGLMGAGGPELLETLFGVHGGRYQGSILLDSDSDAPHQTPCKINNPITAIRQGIAYVSDDRKRDGLLLDQSIAFNLSLTQLQQLSKRGKLSTRLENRQAQQSIRGLQIKCQSSEQLLSELSGGNQQKVVLGKWLAIKPRILLLAEPTRGVDVGAKAEIYQLLGELAQQGMGIILVSSDLPELMALSDRILVLREGESVALLEKPEFSQHRILDYAALGGPQRLIEW